MNLYQVKKFIILVMFANSAFAQHISLMQKIGSDTLFGKNSFTKHLENSDGNLVSCPSINGQEILKLVNDTSKLNLFQCFEKREQQKEYCECVSQIPINSDAKTIEETSKWTEKIKEEISKELMIKDIDREVEKLSNYYGVFSLLSTKEDSTVCNIEEIKDELNLENITTKRIYDRFIERKRQIDKSKSSILINEGYESFQERTSDALSQTRGHLNFILKTKGDLFQGLFPNGVSIRENMSIVTLTGTSEDNNFNESLRIMHENQSNYLLSDESRLSPSRSNFLMNEMDQKLKDNMNGGDSDIYLRPGLNLITKPIIDNASRRITNTVAEQIEFATYPMGTVGDYAQFKNNLGNIINDMGIKIGGNYASTEMDLSSDLILMHHMTESSKRLCSEYLDKLKSDDFTKSLIRIPSPEDIEQKYQQMLTSNDLDTNKKFLEMIDKVLEENKVESNDSNKNLSHEEDKFFSGIYYCKSKELYTNRLSNVAKSIENLDSTRQESLNNTMSQITASKQKEAMFDEQISNHRTAIDNIDKQLGQLNSDNKISESETGQFNHLTNMKVLHQAQLNSLKLRKYEELNRQQRLKTKIAGFVGSTDDAEFIVNEIDNSNQFVSMFEEEDGKTVLLNTEEFHKKIRQNQQQIETSIKNSPLLFSDELKEELIAFNKKNNDRAIIQSSFDNVEALLQSKEGREYYKESFLDIPPISEENMESAILQTRNDMIAQGIPADKVNHAVQHVSDVYQAQSEVIKEVQKVMPQRDQQKSKTNIIPSKRSSSMNTNEVIRASQQMLQNSQEIQQLTQDSNKLLQDRNKTQQKQINQLIDQNKKFEEKVTKITAKSEVSEQVLRNQGSLKDLQEYVQQVNNLPKDQTIFQEQDIIGPITQPRSINSYTEISPLNNAFERSGITAIQRSITTPKTNENNSPIRQDIEAEESINRLPASTVLNKMGINNIPVMTLTEFKDFSTEDFISTEVDQLINQDKEFVIMTNGEQVLVRLFLNDQSQPEYEIIGSVENRKFLEEIVKEKIAIVYKSKRVLRLLELDQELNNLTQ